MAKAKFDHAAFAEGLAEKRHDEISTLLRKLIDSCRTDNPDMQRAFVQRDETILRVNDVQEKMRSNSEIGTTRYTAIMDTLNNILQTVQLNNIPSAIGTGNKQGVWMDRGYIAKLEQKATAYDKVFGPLNPNDAFANSIRDAKSKAGFGDPLTTPKTPMFEKTYDKQLDPYADIAKAIFGDTTVSVGVARDMNRLEERLDALCKSHTQLRQDVFGNDGLAEQDRVARMRVDNRVNEVAANVRQIEVVKLPKVYERLGNIEATANTKRKKK